jgi:hypothetical protein
MDPAASVSAVLTAVDALGSIDLDAIDISERKPLLVQMKQAQSRLEAHIGRATHAADAAGAFIGTGSRDTAEWLAKETGTSTRKNRNATELGEAMSKSDALADAVTSGSISADKASAVVGAAGSEVVDAEILGAVADLPLPAVKPAVEEWRARQHPDRDIDLAEGQRARRYLRLTDQPDGMTRIDGLLDPESGAIVRSTLDGIMNQSFNDGTTRTRDQRCHDAFVQLAHAASKGELKGGRSNTKLLATVPFDTLTERAATRGRTHVGPTLDPATVRKLACDAGIHRVITGPGSSILDFGHETRLVSDNLFLALVARDQHCRWPGCTVRATWCDAHHIIEWTENGPTTDENCALLCHRHHQMSHQPGWKITGDGNELHVRHPDGSIEVSKPPGAAPPRADRIGREPTASNAPPSRSRSINAQPNATAPSASAFPSTSGPASSITPEPSNNPSLFDLHPDQITLA